MIKPALAPRPRRMIAVLGKALRGRPILAVAASTLAVSLIFLAFPKSDLVVAGLFYDPSAGFNDRSLVLNGLRELGALAEWALALALGLPILVKLLAPESRLLVRPRTALFGLATLALGPGLLVNAILKEFWGRARPREIMEFGGDSDFSPVWWIVRECDRNCSFVSGEASAAFWLVVLAFVVPPAWRWTAAIGALAITALVSFARVAAGGHFFSDVVLAWLLTLLVILALREAILNGLPREFDGAVEAALARAGRRVRAWW